MFRAVDAALLTSAWENLPHTVLEALAAGTPVIATAVGGVPEVVLDGENGLLVPAGDVDAIASAIERIVRDDELRASLAARAPVSVEELSEPRILRRIVRAIEEAR
jgi:glycosyltransferase involved in cell wall biosynthesis